MKDDSVNSSPDMPINFQDTQQFSHFELLAKQVVEGFITGLHKSPFHGFSVEFAEHRLYNSGESTRHLDWKLFARTEKLFIKRYEEETNLRCRIVIDNSSSMHFPEVKSDDRLLNKITFSAHCAAALTYLLKMQRDAVGLSVFSDKLELHTQARSSGIHHKLLFTELEKLCDNNRLQTSNKTVASNALHEIAETIHNRSLVIIFSDMFDHSSSAEELYSAIQHLKHNRHEVILFQVTDKEKEEAFMFENRPYIFHDVESGREVKVHNNEVKQVYIEKMQAFKKELQLRCAQYRVELIEADIRDGYKQVLLPFLLKREKMA